MMACEGRLWRRTGALALHSVAKRDASMLVLTLLCVRAIARGASLSSRASDQAKVMTRRLN